MKLKKQLIIKFDITGAKLTTISNLLEGVYATAESEGVEYDSEMWEEQPLRTCENCGKPDPNNDHWDDLDGPNRAGWSCPR